MFRKLISQKSVVINEFKIFLDKDDPLRLSLFGEFENDERKIMKKMIKKGDVVLDVVSHIGFHSLLFSRLVGEKGKVYAFEPHPETFALLEKNIEVNNIKNIKPIQAAISDCNGIEKLYLNKYSNASHAFYNPENMKKFIQVKTIRLDSYNKIKADFIKIDVEGAERKVLKGMIELIKRSPNLKMMIEFVPHTSEKSGITTKEFLTTLEKYFKLYEINRENLVKTSHKELIKKYTVKNRKGTNLFCDNKIK